MKHINIADLEKGELLLNVENGKTIKIPDVVLNYYNNPKSIKIIGSPIGFVVTENGRYVCIKEVLESED